MTDPDTTQWDQFDADVNVSWDGQSAGMTALSDPSRGASFHLHRYIDGTGAWAANYTFHHYRDSVSDGNVYTDVPAIAYASGAKQSTTPSFTDANGQTVSLSSAPSVQLSSATSDYRPPDVITGPAMPAPKSGANAIVPAVRPSLDLVAGGASSNTWIAHFIVTPRSAARTLAALNALAGAPHSDGVGHSVFELTRGAERVEIRVDDAAGLNGSLVEYDRYVDDYGDIYALLVTQPCDALLPNYAVQFPHAVRNEFVGHNIAHTMQTSNVAVRNRLEYALSNDLGVPPRPPGSVASVAVSPNPASVATGSTRQLSATAYDIDNNVLSGKTFSWSSGNTGVATVSASGSVTGVSVGSTTITASSEGYNGTATVNVTPSGPTVSISGPSSVQPSVLCAWFANVSSGTAPYSYSWTAAGWPEGSNADELDYTNSGASFVITLTVRDANGGTGSASRNVTVSSNAMACPY